MRFHSLTVNFIEKIADALFLISIVLETVVELLSVNISFIFCLPIIWIPIISFLSYYYYNEYYTLPEQDEKLLIGMHKFQNAAQAVKAFYHFHYVTNTLGIRESRYWFDGLMNIHAKICARGNRCGFCYYYNKKFSEKRNTSVLDESEEKILNVFKKSILRNLLKQFPNSDELKLAYFYLASFKEHKDKDYLQNMQIKGIILKFHYARFTSKNKKRKSADKRVNDERQAILDSAILLSRFWELVQDDNADVGQVYDVGKQAFEKIQLLNKIEKQAIDDYEALADIHMLYRQYMQLVFLENFESESENVSHHSSKRHSKKGEEKAWAKLSTKNKTMGQILDCNQSFGKIFGFSKLELVGRKVDKFIPKIYQGFYELVQQKIMEEYWKPVTKNVNITYQMFGEHKNDYIFPFKLRIEKLSSAFKGRDMLISVDIEKKNFSPRILYVLTDVYLNITQFSSSVSSLIGTLNEKKMIYTRLSKYIERLELVKWEEVFCTKEGSEAEFNFDEIPQSRHMLCKAGRLELEKLHLGYWFRIEFDPEQFVLVKDHDSCGSVKDDGGFFEYNEPTNKYVIYFHGFNKETGKNKESDAGSLYGSGIWSIKNTERNNAKETKNEKDDSSKRSSARTSYFYIRLIQSVSSGPYANQLKEIHDNLVEKVFFSI